MREKNNVQIPKILKVEVGRFCFRSQSTSRSRNFVYANFRGHKALNVFEIVYTYLAKCWKEVIAVYCTISLIGIHPVLRYVFP